jgi:hypothetical protein
VQQVGEEFEAMIVAGRIALDTKLSPEKELASSGCTKQGEFQYFCRDT